MVCLSCLAMSRATLCQSCLRRMVVGPDVSLDDGTLVATGFVHVGPARRLVHRLKYEAVGEAAAVLAAGMAVRVPPEARLLVPVPRVRARAVAFGADPSVELARRLSALTGIPAVDALVPPLFSRARAGMSRNRRRGLAFTRRRPVGPGAVLIDDVITTGRTLASAVAAIEGEVVGCVTATASL